ncbi:MAG: hypothetical protein WCX30_00060 [Candidatus Paceibacterota bacterium]|jgi:hypothetical protein|nr:hypothetical protein [bacterium]
MQNVASLQTKAFDSSRSFCIDVMSIARGVAFASISADPPAGGDSGWLLFHPPTGGNQKPSPPLEYPSILSRGVPSNKFLVKFFEGLAQPQSVSYKNLLIFYSTPDSPPVAAPSLIAKTIKPPSTPLVLFALMLCPLQGESPSHQSLLRLAQAGF